MTLQSLSIGIAGCGVGGLAAGALLAARGARVVCFDRMDAPRPLGSGLILQPVGLAVLDAIGAGVSLRRLGTRIDRLHGRAQPGGRVVLDVRYAARGKRRESGLAVHRGALFESLLRAAQSAGVDVASGRAVAGHDGGGRLTFQDGSESARFDLVVDALGAWSPLSRPPHARLPFGALWANVHASAGFDPHALEQRYQRASRMAGVLPLGRMSPGGHPIAAYFWSLRQDAYAAWRERGIRAWRDEALALWPETEPLLAQIEDPDQLVFASYAHRTLASPAGRRLAHVGDSWHCASPQLGQGANMALLDALALAEALTSEPNLEEALADYARRRVWHIRLYQLASWMFTPAYQSDADWPVWVRDGLMAPVSRVWPAPGLLARLVAGELLSPLSTLAGRRDGKPVSVLAGHDLEQQS